MIIACRTCHVVECGTIITVRSHLSHDKVWWNNETQENMNEAMKYLGLPPSPPPPPNPQLLIKWIVEGLAYPFDGPMSTDPEFPREWREALIKEWLRINGEEYTTLEDQRRICYEEGGWTE